MLAPLLILHGHAFPFATTTMSYLSLRMSYLSLDYTLMLVGLLLYSNSEAIIPALLNDNPCSLTTVHGCPFTTTTLSCLSRGNCYTVVLAASLLLHCYASRFALTTLYCLSPSLLPRCYACPFAVTTLSWLSLRHY